MTYGQVAGTWRPVAAAGGVEIHARGRTLKRAEREALAAAAARYGLFLDAPVTLVRRT